MTGSTDGWKDAEGQTWAQNSGGAGDVAGSRAGVEGAMVGCSGAWSGEK